MAIFLVFLNRYVILMIFLMILNRFTSAKTLVAGNVGNFVDVASQSRLPVNNILTVNFIESKYLEI